MFDKLLFCLGLFSRGGQACTLYWSHLCVQNSLKIATKICQFSQYLGTKLDMLSEIAKSVEKVKTFRENNYFTTLHNVCAVHRGVCNTMGDVQYTGGIS